MDHDSEVAVSRAGVQVTGGTEERTVPVEARRPSREALRAAYDTAIRDIEAKRGTRQFENGFHRQIADAVFEGCFSALEHFAEWAEQRGEPRKASHRELREVRQGIATNTVPPRLNVVTAPMGTGKTTFTTAFIIAMVRFVHDASLEDVAAALKSAQVQQHSDVVPHLHRLVQFMAPKSVSGAQIEKPKDDRTSWVVARELDWFATAEAAYYAKRHCLAMPKLEAVFGFAKAMVRDYAFIASGSQGPSFVGYEPRHAVVPGMVLLDATADLDGITRLCPWRSHVDVPRGDFRNLHIVHVSPLTTDPLVTFLSRNRNRQRYIDWMKSLVLDNVAPGQQALVVCKKKLIGKPQKPGQATVPDWPEDDERFNDPSQYQERFGSWMIVKSH
jgi:hypothetical protein